MAATSTDCLPSEVLLDILSQVEYDPNLRTSLRLVSKRFKHIVDGYESCISGTILDTQFAWSKRQFPSLFRKALGASSDSRRPAWDHLRDIHKRIATLASIKSRCKIIREGHSDHSAWTTCRALVFYHSGLLLLYRLADCDSHQAKAALLRSLPKSSLAVLIFSLMVSVHVMRAVHIPFQWVESPMTEEMRSEIELAMEEVTLRSGPEFLLGLLLHDRKALNTLQREVASMDARQLHSADGNPPDPTLIATMRQTFSVAVRCEIRYNLVHMWYVLDEDCAEMTDAREQVAREAMEKVVNGVELKRTCERCRLMRLYGY